LGIVLFRESANGPKNRLPARHAAAHPETALRVSVTMVTAVWGDWHIRQLLELNLPTLMADGNLPNLARRHAVSYRIFTRKADMESLAGSPVIEHLRSLMPIELFTLPDDILKNPIAAHHHAWDEATQAAQADDSFVLYLPPDVAWSDQSFAHLADLLAAGRQAIFMTYLRAESSSFTAAMRARRPIEGYALPISGRELVALALDCLHPLMGASLRTSSRLPRHPEMLFWAIPGEGLSLRVLAREMFLFNPRRISLNAASLIGNEIDPSEIQFVSDSDQLFAVSLAELGKDVDWHMKLRAADPVEIGRWWLNYDSPANDMLASHKIRWHFNPSTEAEWRQRERAGDLFVRRCGVVREGLRLRAIAQEMGCSKAAQLIAFAAHWGILEHVVRGNGVTTILMPVNAAFTKLPDGFFEHLLTQASGKDLTRFLRAHCIVASRPRALPDNTTGAAATLRKVMAWLRLVGRTEKFPELGDANIIGRPILAGRHIVLLIDRCLGLSR
jgi:hypothetical protein